MQELVIEPVAADSVPQRGHQVLDRAPDRRTRRAALARSKVAKPLEQRLDFLRTLLEMAAALVGRLERLARALARRLLDQAHVLEQGQRRVDDAGARSIFAAGQLLDCADEVVAVARLVRDQLQQDQAKLARFEHPAPSAAALAQTA